MRIKNKKGQLDARGIMTLLLVLGIGLVVVGIIFAFGAKVNADIQSTFGNTEADNTSKAVANNSLTGLVNMSNQFGTIGLIGAAVVIIVLVLLIARVAGVRF